MIVLNGEIIKSSCKHVIMDVEYSCDMFGGECLDQNCKIGRDKKCCDDALLAKSSFECKVTGYECQGTSGENCQIKDGFDCCCEVCGGAMKHTGDSGDCSFHDEYYYCKVCGTKATVGYYTMGSSEGKIRDVIFHVLPFVKGVIKGGYCGYILEELKEKDVMKG